ncbi:MAG: fold metallo-hydrolase [Bacteroidetes bacterium]|jgi:glyoxylase-like metal-dependent hydrolase (beta-lactamase superfamily II)/rhodanese-related sulfurtransferase|nr:fold metallo-hydrolase [Bacteroidota bacterium]
MYIEQLYTSCLAEAAYYIESDGVAAIIDPLRETTPYIALAKKRNATIKYVFETHFHADFVSGHIDLARASGASIVYGPTAETGYETYVAKDNEIFEIGKIKIKVLHTPGHTLESSCFLLMDENGKDHAIFTGDTLFVGDVGRPDLAIKSDLTVDDLAGMLYDSLNSKIKPLADEVIVYPAHGAGSSCGKNIGKETFSTIGQQKKLNYAMQPMSKEEFVKAVTTGLTEAPQYFALDATLNKKGYSSIDEVLNKNTVALSVTEFEAEINKGSVILDVRTPDEFEKGFIPDSVNIGLNGQYAPWVGSLLNPNVPLILVTDEGKETEAVLRLARVGYEKVNGYLKGGFNSWKNAGKAVDTVQSITATDFAAKLESNPELNVLDVRKPGEVESGMVEGANHICLSGLQKELNALDKNKQYYIHCAGGYRSMMAASILKKKGFDNVINVLGGMGKIKETGLKLVQPISSL